MTGFDIAAALRRKLNDDKSVFSDGEVLDALNLGLLELGRELPYWSERFEFEPNEEGVTALPDRFLAPLSATLNDQPIEIRPASALPSREAIVIDGFSVKTPIPFDKAGKPPSFPPYQERKKAPDIYKIEYRTFAQIGALTETLPIPTAITDLLITYCVMKLKERIRGEKWEKDLTLWTIKYQNDLGAARARLRSQTAGLNLTTKHIIC
jgi:hypothetical protein